MKLTLPRWLVNLLPSLLALTLFCVAIVAIVKELRQYSPQTIWQSLQSIPPQNLLLAIGLMSLNYLVFTGYDALAVRYIQHHIPYRKTAVAAIVSTAVSNSVGFGLLSGSAIRYRFYSTWQFTATEIAHIIAFCNLSFWLGLLAVGGVVFTLHSVTVPTLLHLPFQSARPLGGVFLAVVIGYLIWNAISRRALRIGDFEFPHLSVPVAIAQISVAALDWTIAALILYVLLPGSVSHSVFFSVYLLGQIAGIVSNIPGGLGVFETILLLLLTPLLPTATLLGRLIAYRMIYYFLPLFIAVILFSKYELRRNLSRS